MGRINLDMDVLRTVVTAQQLGSFNRAADRLGRSQSAISQQVRKLEEQMGQPLFEKQGRGLVPTAAGEMVLAYARRILDLNDEAVSAVRGFAIDGQVRMGLPADFAESWLPAVLGRFRRAHPAVRIEAVVDRNGLLLASLDKGELDLVLSLGNDTRKDAEPVGTLPLRWIGPPSFDLGTGTDEPIPLAMYQAPCFFRRHALAALDNAGLPWRIAFTSPSLHGLWAAVEAGLGLTLRTAIGLPDRLGVIMDPAQLPQNLPHLAVSLHDGGRSLPPAAARLRGVVLETLADKLPDAAGRPIARPVAAR